MENSSATEVQRWFLVIGMTTRDTLIANDVEEDGLVPYGGEEYLRHSQSKFEDIESILEPTARGAFHPPDISTLVPGHNAHPFASPATGRREHSVDGVAGTSTGMPPGPNTHQMTRSSTGRHERPVADLAGTSVGRPPCSSPELLPPTKRIKNAAAGLNKRGQGKRGRGVVKGPVAPSGRPVRLGSVVREEAPRRSQRLGAQAKA